MSTLYLVAVHSVFESQSRYHDPIVGLLATIAALAIWQPTFVRVPPGQRDRAGIRS